MNPVLVVTHNCYSFTVKAIASIMAQDIPVSLTVIDNGSDETLRQFLSSLSDTFRNVEVVCLGANLGVSKAWNIGLAAKFGEGAEHVLVLNNDLEIPPHFYRTLIESGELFVSGVNCGVAAKPYWNNGWVRPADHATLKNPHPDFSAFLIRRQCWETVGYFDEDMVYYAQDCDYHVRMHRARIWAGSLNLEYHHHASATINQADDVERAAISAQANLDRGVFRKKYDCEIGSPEYDKLFS